MGLDIYFHKRHYSSHNPNEIIGTDEYGYPKRKDMPEVAYFRKVNFLMSFFDYFGRCEAEGDDEGDGTYVPISHDDVADLIKACEKTLGMKEEIKERLLGDGTDFSDVPLQPLAGFFFGSTDMNEFYFQDVEFVLDTFKEIEANLKDDEELFMYASW